MSDQKPQQPSPLEALKFLDEVLGKVPGSRQDHVAIQGAVGVIGMALQPQPEVSDIAPDGLPSA